MVEITIGLIKTRKYRKFTAVIGSLKYRISFVDYQNNENIDFILCNNENITIKELTIIMKSNKYSLSKNLLNITFIPYSFNISSLKELLIILIKIKAANLSKTEIVTNCLRKNNFNDKYRGFNYLRDLIISYSDKKLNKSIYYLLAKKYHCNINCIERNIRYLISKNNNYVGKSISNIAKELNRICIKCDIS